MDQIQLTGVTGYGYHGVFDHERREGQNFSVDLSIGADFTQAAASDDVTDTVHYGEVANMVHAHITGEPVNLIERLAANIAADILATFTGVLELAVTIHKPDAPIEVPFDSVSVTYHARRADDLTEEPEQQTGAQGPARQEAVLALGSNLGQKDSTLDSAIAALRAHPDIEVLAVSPRAVTKAVGGPADQPDYVNLVLKVATTLKPFELLGACQQIEADHDRVREVRWGPRTLDIDMITYGTLTQASPILTLPHPRAHERAFVLAPWSWLEPDATLAGTPITELLERCTDRDGLTKVEAEGSHRG